MFQLTSKLIQNLYGSWKIKKLLFNDEKKEFYQEK